MNPFEKVIGIVLIVSIAGVLKAKYGVRKDQRGNETHVDQGKSTDENNRLRDEILSLKERIQVLERVITDDQTSASLLDREIERLRDKDSV